MAKHIKIREILRPGLAASFAFASFSPQSRLRPSHPQNALASASSVYFNSKNSFFKVDRQTAAAVEKKSSSSAADGSGSVQVSVRGGGVLLIDCST